MTIKVFVDWDEREIINETEYKEKIRQETEKTMADKETFYDWLEDNYMAQTIWEMTEAERAEVQGLWEQWCKDYAEVESDFEMIMVEI